MTQASSKALATWLLATHPGLFATILKTQGKKLSGLGDDDVLEPVDVTAQYSDDYLQPVDVTAQYSDLLQPVDVTAQYINDPLQPVNVTAQSIPINTSAANATTANVVSSLGSSLGSAVASVATFLLKGAAAVAPVAVAAFNAQTATANQNAQMAVLAQQVNRATAGVAPANIAYTANGTPVYLPTASATGGLTTLPAGLGAAVTLPNGQVGYTLTPQALSNLSPTFLQQYGVWIIGGGVTLAALLLFS